MKLSIITINYNNLEGLRKTIESVVNQTWQEFEWIIVDGGSTDGSKELIEETSSQIISCGWSIKHFSEIEDFVVQSFDTKTIVPHCLKWCSEKDKGVYNAMNKGILNSYGKYLLFLNSGDTLYNNTVLESVNVLGWETDIIYGACQVLSPKLSVWDVPEEKVNALLFVKGSLPHQSIFFKKDLFIKFGLYDETLHIASDWKFCIDSLIFGNSTFRHVPLIISTYEGDGLSTNYELLKKERASVLQSHFPVSIIQDLELACSLKEVQKYSFSRFLYSVVYRMANFWNMVHN